MTGAAQTHVSIEIIGESRNKRVVAIKQVHITSPAYHMTIDKLIDDTKPDHGFLLL